MIISIKSEIDSRVLLYPLMKTCSTFGSVLVMTNNRYVSRLIDDEEYSTFKNIAIVVEDAASSDDIYDEFDIAPDDYDYIIIDNMGVASYDKCFCLFGQKQSDTFMEDKALMEQNENVEDILFVEFGKGARSASKQQIQAKKDKPAKKKKSSMFNKQHDAPARDNADVDDTDEQDIQEDEFKDYDPAEKFRNKVEEEQKKSVATYNVPFPTFDMIENLESMGQFEPVEEKLCHVFYDAIGKSLNIQYNYFRKEIRQIESSSGNKSAERAGR